MNVQKRNGVSIYCLSAGATLPEWLGDRARRNLSKSNESVRRRIELLQDFGMPASSSKLAQSPDGRYILAAGTYPPRLRCYDVTELGLKFERYVHAGIVDLTLLGDDYGKVAMLLDDRTVAIHAHYGAHASVRVPTFGRAICYEPTTCDVLVAAEQYVYRLNLEEGRFHEPYALKMLESSSMNTNAAVSASSMVVHPTHPLLTVGCDDGTVRLWDSRISEALVHVNVAGACRGTGWNTKQNDSTVITAVAHDNDWHMAVGTATGIVALYDVRSSRPLTTQTHKSGQAVHTVHFHETSNMILSGDRQVIKVWRYKAGAGITTRSIGHAKDVKEDDADAIGSVLVNIEGSNGNQFTHFTVARDETNSHSGVLLAATDQPKMDSFYVPALGVAPKWCSYLESITEELEERDLQRSSNDAVKAGHESVFENYKFVTRDDLEKLGISNLIGTPLLRGYMHGFFMDVSLYNRTKAVANPFEYEEYQKKKLKERLDAKQSSRIASNKKSKKKTFVNPDLAERLEHKAEDTTKAGKLAKGLLSDDRFGGLFTNPDFEIDQEDEDFKLRNPSGVAATKRKTNDLDSDDDTDDGEDDNQRALVDEPDIRIDDSLQEDENVSDSEEEDGFAKVRGEAYEGTKQQENEPRRQQRRKTMKTTMVAVDTSEVGDISHQHAHRQKLMNLPISSRKALELQDASQAPRIHLEGGSKEVTYIPRGSKQREQDEPNRRGKDRSRRGVKELGFKAPFRRGKK